MFSQTQKTNYISKDVYMFGGLLPPKSKYMYSPNLKKSSKNLFWIEEERISTTIYNVCTSFSTTPTVDLCLGGVYLKKFCFETYVGVMIQNALSHTKVHICNTRCTT